MEFLALEKIMEMAPIDLAKLESTSTIDFEKTQKNLRKLRFESKVRTLRTPYIILPCLKRTKLLRVLVVKLFPFRLIYLSSLPFCNPSAIGCCQPYPLHEILVVVTLVSLNSLLV